MTSVKMESTSIQRSAWVAVTLAAATQAVNQIDKAVVSLAAEPIMAELDLSTTQYGAVAGSLYALFSLGGIAVGLFAAPRFTARQILIALLIIWSLLQLPIVFAASLAVLVACRVLLGAAEGSGAAMCVNACHDWFPDSRRELPGALMFIGGTLGPMLAAPLLTFIIAEYGWRGAFLACSVIGVVVTLGWVFSAIRPPCGGGDGADRDTSLLCSVTPLIYGPHYYWLDDRWIGGLLDCGFYGRLVGTLRARSGRAGY